jgi:hypothetical protein
MRFATRVVPRHTAYVRDEENEVQSDIAPFALVCRVKPVASVFFCGAHDDPEAVSVI